MTRRLCLVLVLAPLLASFAPAAERAPLPGPPTDWRAVGDTLLYAGAVVQIVELPQSETR